MNEGVCECGGALIGEVKPEHHFSIIGGIPLMLKNSVIEYKCGGCDEIEYYIPDLEQLNAAVALTRAKISAKLKGHEISFLRKAINLSAKKFAANLDVTPETLSRWENNKLPMSPIAERLLRIWVGLLLESAAPAIDFDLKDIAVMEFRSIYEDNMELVFERVKYKEKSQVSEDTYAEAA